MPIRKICAECGSTDIVCQGLGRWDEESQDWVFDLQIDSEYCSECDSLEVREIETDDGETT